jgi:hypothetical protein
MAVVRWALLLGWVLLVPGFVGAEDFNDAPPEPGRLDWLAEERFSAQFLTGVYYSAIGPGAWFNPATRRPTHGPPHFDLVTLDARLGYRPLLAPPEGGGQLFDRFQVLADFQAAPVYRGLGNYVFGPSLLLRCDLLHPSCRLVPYVQGGAGLAFTDGYKAPDQRALGRFQEFFLQGMGGLRWRLSDSWSLDIEGGWQHISNADLAKRNAGINDLGGSIGVTYSFGARPCRTEE